MAPALDPERPPSPPSAMERCAPEVWVEILRRIGGSKAARNRSLKAASLVFKALAPYAQAELFRCINIKNVSDAERLLATFTSNRALQRCILELKLDLASPRDKDPLYQWLLLEPNSGVLASFTRVTFLEIQSLNPAPDVQTIISIFSHFKAVKHLQFGGLFEYNDFKQVAALFTCLGATLQHLDIRAGITFEDYEASEIDDIPSKLSAETLSHYTPQDALPHLESLKFYAGIGPEIIEWLFRSGVVDRIRTFELDPEISQDLEYTALILSRGCRRLECLILHMISEGWEGIDTSIGTLSCDVFGMSLTHASCQPRFPSLRTSKRFASSRLASDTRTSSSLFSQHCRRKTL
jgi:hypothetical protein